MRRYTGIKALTAFAAFAGLWAIGEPPAHARPPGRTPGHRLPEGTGRLRNAAQGMCLDVAGWAAAGDSNVLLWECNDDPDQVWSFTQESELHNVLTRQTLDAAGYRGAEGADVRIFRPERLADQRWVLSPRGPGMFELRNMKRNLCLDVNGRAGARGDDVLLWSCDGGRDQLWTWEPYPDPPTRRIHKVGPYRPGQPSAPVLQPIHTAPRPVPPPPLAPDDRMPRGARAMDDASFRRLIGTVRREGFSENKIAVIQMAADANHFRVEQVKALLGELSFSATKLRALELVAPKLVDPQNGFALNEAFSFTADKERAKEILRRQGY